MKIEPTLSQQQANLGTSLVENQGKIQTDGTSANPMDGKTTPRGDTVTISDDGKKAAASSSDSNGKKGEAAATGEKTAKGAEEVDGSSGAKEAGKSDKEKTAEGAGETSASESSSKDKLTKKLKEKIKVLKAKIQELKQRAQQDQAVADKISTSEKELSVLTSQLLTMMKK
ncbi:MAG: hypothetical protein JEZ12_12050 [Desulfobacterium sp.]|nr:hypothetical protein [Desulfobacterium sp.]